MGTGLNIITTYATDFLGALLMLMLLLSKGWSIPTKRSESYILLAMIVASLAGCVFDAIGWMVDGRPGALNRFGVYASNTILFSLNVVLGPGCITILTKHINRIIPAWHRNLIAALCTAELGVLVVNLFVPLVFAVDENNVYSRRAFFWVYMAVEGALIFYGLWMYFAAIARGRLLQFFPAWLFVIPMAAAMVVQSLVYGVSLIWPCVGISFCALTICLQQESIFLDKLTGVYNRYYLDGAGGMKHRKIRRSFAAMMIDMNGFKEINDRYSHAAGDEALVVIANILRDTVRTEGTVVRFAGDEFIVLINRTDEDVIDEYKNKIQASIAAYNAGSGKPYQLSAALGGALFDWRKDNIMDFMSSIDQRMYEDKEAYYKSHDRRAERPPETQGERR